jgi:hypothetical protein
VIATVGGKENPGVPVCTPVAPAFHLVDAVVEYLAVLDQRTELAVFLRRHVDGLEFVDRRHAGQFQCVVPVGLSLDIGPLPGVFIGGADKRLESEADGQIVDPSGRPAGFHDHQIDGLAFQDRGQIGPVGSGKEEGIFACFRVEKRQHIVLNLPRSSARIFMFERRQVLGLE